MEVQSKNFHICRLCAQVTKEVIGIFNSTTSNIQEKINYHLPINVNENDSLPLTTCLSCLKTLMEFDQLVTKCIEASKHFQELEALKMAEDVNIPKDTFNAVVKLEQDEQILEIPTPSNSQDLKTFWQADILISHEQVNTEVDPNSVQTKPVEDYYQEISLVIKNQKSKKRKTNEKSNERDFINNAQEIIDGKIYYKCKTCGKCLLSPYTYKSHIKIHTGERPFVCDLCGKQFRAPQGLGRHINETHAGIRKFPCDLCDRKFSSRRNVEEHRHIHTNERPYVCDLCGKTFKQKASLFVHNRSHTDIFPFPCTYCEQAFRTNTILMRHITRHTGEKPHTCDECGKSFRIKNELNRHKLVHSDKKPFQCNFCGLGFRMNRYLKNHLKQNHKQE